MKPYSPSGPHGLALVFLVLGLACGTVASANAEAPAPGRGVASIEVASALPQSHGADAAPGAAAAPLPPAARSRGIVIGSAPEGLLALQRDAAGARPRPIDGEQASRSYQRYLKSFETSIPEHYSTGLDLKKQ